MHTSTQYLIIRRCYNSFRLSKYECPALDYKSVMWRFSSNSGLTYTSVTVNNVAGGHRWIALIFRINDCFPYLSCHCHMTWYWGSPWTCLCAFLSSSIRPSCASCSSCCGILCCRSMEKDWESSGATLWVQAAAWSVMDVMYFLPFVNNCHSGYIWKCRFFFFNALDVFTVKTCYECVVLGISFCVNKASTFMHEVLSLQTCYYLKWSVFTKSLFIP